MKVINEWWPFSVFEHIAFDISQILIVLSVLAVAKYWLSIRAMSKIVSEVVLSWMVLTGTSYEEDEPSIDMMTRKFSEKKSTHVCQSLIYDKNLDRTLVDSNIHTSTKRSSSNW